MSEVPEPAKRAKISTHTQQYLIFLLGQVLSLRQLHDHVLPMFTRSPATLIGPGEIRRRPKGPALYFADFYIVNSPNPSQEVSALRVLGEVQVHTGQWLKRARMRFNRREDQEIEIGPRIQVACSPQLLDLGVESLTLKFPEPNEEGIPISRRIYHLVGKKHDGRRDSGFLYYSLPLGYRKLSEAADRISDELYSA